MAANLTKYLEDKWLAMLKGTAFTAPTVYVGLVSDSANEAELEGDTPTAHEITGYTGNRKAITFGSITKSGTDPSQMSGPPSTAIEFESMPAPAGRTAKYTILCDAATGGNVLGWSAITDGPKSWNTNDIFRIAVNQITVKLD
jgi:hypothetical protein